MECYYHYQAVGGYVQMSVYDSLDDIQLGVDGDADIDVLAYDYEFINIAKAILSHAFAGDTALAEKCAQDFITSDLDVAHHDVITLHQIEDWVANWKRMQCSKPR